MQQMPPLEDAVRPPVVEPPSFVDRHPRFAVVLRTLPWMALTLFMADRLRTEGFGWFAASGLVLAAVNLGYSLAKLDRGDPSDAV